MRAVADIDVEGAEEAVQLNQPAPPAPHSLTGTHRHSNLARDRVQTCRVEKNRNI